MDWTPSGKEFIARRNAAVAEMNTGLCEQLRPTMERIRRMFFEASAARLLSEKERLEYEVVWHGSQWGEEHGQ